VADEHPEIGFVLALGRALHRYGTPAHRLEEALRVVCARMGMTAEVFSTPTSIIMSFGAPAELRTRMMRVDGGELDMGKLAQVDALADAVAAQEIAPEDGVRLLHAILASPPAIPRVVTALTHAVTAGAFAVFFGGSLADVAVAGAVGLMLGGLAQVLARSTDQARVYELAGAAFAALAAGLASAAWPTVSPALVTLASLVMLLPGMSLTVAMTELATRNPIAGTARLTSAVVVLLELVIGVAIGDRIAVALVHVHQAVPAPLPAWTHAIALLASSVGVAVIVQAQPRAFGWIIAACVAGYFGSRAGTYWLGGQLGVVVGAFALGVLSNVYARWFDRPAQVVQVPAIFTLVPGSMGFRGMDALLERDTLTGVDTVFAMFIVAMAIVAGLLVASAVVSPRRVL
jgi:uncharacterized membrane protein YjjP (DUF1212 family)